MNAIRVLLLACAAAGAVSAQEPADRRVYVSVLDSNGASVDDLTAADFTVKEGGKTRTISRAAPTQTKMQIAILVDDNGTGIFRVAVARFIEALLGRAEFSISVVTGQTRRLVDYSTDTRVLSEAVAKLRPRPSTNDGNQLLDGITGTSLEMAKRKAARPVIVALTVGGDDVTPMQPDDALDELRRSGAQFYVVSVVGSSQRPTARPVRPADMLNEAHALSAVLGDGPKRSGGYREEISAIAGVDPRLTKLAEQLKHQYAIDYAADRGKPSSRISVSVSRKNVTLRAPTHVPDKK